MKIALRAPPAIVAALTLLAGGARAGETPDAKKPPEQHTLYVADSGNNSVTIYHPGKKADLKPKQLISGGNTRLASPEGVAIDAHGNVFVVSDANPGIVTEYSHKQKAKEKGDVAPIAEITGTTTQMVFPFGIALDSTDNVYVTNIDPFVDTIEKFAPLPAGSNDPAPVATIGGSETGLDNPAGILVDSGGAIFVVNNFGETVEEFASPAAGANNVAPIASLGGASTGLDSPWGIALDLQGHIYVANSGNDSVTKYAPLVAGPEADTAPIATIAGTNTGLDEPEGVAVDSRGYVYVCNFGSNSVFKFAPPAAGANNATPIEEVEGTKTLLDEPALITLGK